jgi:O-antigen biosynthesis protein
MRRNQLATRRLSPPRIAPPGDRYFPIDQEDIAVHWRYLGVIGPESAPNKIGVRVDLCDASISSLEDGRELMMFIVDEEMKTMTDEDLRICLRNEGHTLHFPSPSPGPGFSKGGKTGGCKSHCIVTPDFIGPVKNGGIGTATLHLAVFLRRELGHKVTVVFTGPVQSGTSHAWKSHYEREHGFIFLTLEDLPANPDIPHHCAPWFLLRSHQVHRWLRTQQFDSIHFQDWQANGFVPVQAKQQGLAYDHTLLTCTLHSPQEWVDEGSRQFPAGGLDDILQRYAERYAACRADLTMAPSRHMLEWARQRGWEPRHSEIVPYLWTSAPAKTPAPGPDKVTELCFFGRWETRKGLEVFTGALERLAARLGPKSLPRLTFLGKPGFVAGGYGRFHIEQTGRRLGLTLTLIDDLDSASAQHYLASRPGCVAVIPSLWDNLPYTVIECLQNGTTLLASDVGGVPELIASPEHLFQPNETSLAAALERVVTQGITPVRSAYNPERPAAQWTRLAEAPAPTRARREIQADDVTVCIAHHNHGRYLPELLHSLARQTAVGFHVIVVDDGSNDEASVSKFLELQQAHAVRPTWRFLRKANGGIGETRNFAVAQSSTRLIVFLDADNIATADMVETMVAAMRVTEADCLTCYFEGFRESSLGGRKPIYRYLPTGGCLEAGVFKNVFGDANCIIDREAFLAVGGFSTERGVSFEDWDFFARLCLRGRKLDTIPKIIHHYRHTEEGFSRRTSKYLNHRRIISAYSSQMSPWMIAMLEGLYATVVPEANAGHGNVSLSGLPLTGRDALSARQAQRICEIERSTSMLITSPLRQLSHKLRRVFAPSTTPTSQTPGAGIDPMADPDALIREQARKIQALEGSLSWRISLPVRLFGTLIRRAADRKTPSAP